MRENKGRTVKASTITNGVKIVYFVVIEFSAERRNNKVTVSRIQLNFLFFLFCFFKGRNLEASRNGTRSDFNSVRGNDRMHTVISTRRLIFVKGESRYTLRGVISPIRR